MKRQVAIMMFAALIVGLLLGTCGCEADTGLVGPVGPVGPQGAVGPQPLSGTPRPNLTIIEDTDVLLTKEYAFNGFARVEVSDGFDVHIRRGEGFRVSAQFEETAVPYIQMSQAGDTLTICLEDGRTYHMVDVTMNVEITMPELSGLVLKEGADVTVAGLDGFEAEVDFLSKLHHLPLSSQG